MSNSSALIDSLDPPLWTPWYYARSPSIIPGVPDKYLTLMSPIVAYWSLSIFFHILDVYSTSPYLRWLHIDSYRIHESEEVTKRNRVTPKEVVRAVILQHAIQTALGLLWIEDDNSVKAALRNDHQLQMRLLAPWLVKTAIVFLGRTSGERLIRAYGSTLLWYTYWWFIPTVQFFAACAIVDTWQYFLHRLFHVNKFLYKHFHSVHHRLYVPYAYGALYNHPFEGFLLDSLGAVIAETLCHFSTRQSCFLFGFASLKTVDDHCGFALPWDPFQWFYQNTARYHDIHHQHYGLKYNFSQPFYIHWDVVLGTRWDKGHAPLPCEREAAAAKQKEE